MVRFLSKLFRARPSPPPDDSAEPASGADNAETEATGISFTRRQIELPVSSCDRGVVGCPDSPEFFVSGDWGTKLHLYRVSRETGLVETLKGVRDVVRAGAIDRARNRLWMCTERRFFEISLDPFEVVRSTKRGVPRFVDLVHLDPDHGRAFLCSHFSNSVAVFKTDDLTKEKAIRLPAIGLIRPENGGYLLVSFRGGKARRYSQALKPLGKPQELPECCERPAIDANGIYAVPSSRAPIPGVIHGQPPVMNDKVFRSESFEIILHFNPDDLSLLRPSDPIPGLARLIGVDGSGRLVGVGDNVITLIDPESLQPVARGDILGAWATVQVALVGPYALGTHGARSATVIEWEE